MRSFQEFPNLSWRGCNMSAQLQYVACQLSCNMSAQLTCNMSAQLSCTVSAQAQSVS